MRKPSSESSGSVSQLNFQLRTINLVNKGQTSHYEWKTSPGMETYDKRFHYPVDSSKVLEEFGTMFFAGVSKSQFGLLSMINNYCGTDNPSTQLRRYVEVGWLRHPGDGDCTNGWQDLTTQL